MYWYFPPCVKRGVMSNEGTQKILKQFVSKVRDAGFEREILAFPATSIVAMRTFELGISKWPELGRPDVVYLDSAHLAGEVLLEMELAWKLLPNGGILFGDDWFFGEVKQDVLQFATMYEMQLDHQVHLKYPAPFPLGHVRGGVYVTYTKQQWIFVKDVEPGHDSLTTQEYAMRAQSGNWAFGQCFTDPSQGLSHEECCHPRWGEAGNPACWDVVFTVEICCHPLDEITEM